MILLSVVQIVVVAATPAETVDNNSANGVEGE
jgi:hypothetical protein